MSKSSEGKHSAEHWQKKFYNSLDELEEKEKEWLELENLLRLLASRLSLAAEGKEARFDKQLDKLRDTLRVEKNSYRLKKVIDEVSSSISRLERTTSKQDTSAVSAAPLIDLLKHIQIPNSLERQNRYVQKKLIKANDEAAIKDVVKDVAELLALVIEQFAKKRAGLEQEDSKAEQIVNDSGKTEEEKSGLISQLFKRKKESHEEQQSEEPVEKSNEQLISQKENIVVEESALSPNLTLAAETLIRLLEKLSLPGDLHIQADLIKKKLEPCHEAHKLAEGLDATAELVAEMHSRVQKEKKELEEFLQQLTQRLQELDLDIQETVKLRDQSYQAGQKVNSDVNSEVTRIEDSVDKAVDLDTLKTSIQSRVIIIRDHMDRFLEEEEHRHESSNTVIESLMQKLEKAENETDQLRVKVLEAQEAAKRDQLTGIPNRLAYDQTIQEEIARYKRYQTPFSLMVWDVDKFKNINDTYGHAAGDKVLTVIAKILHSSVRETDRVARYGGEEFVAILPETNLQQSQPLAEKLRKSIEETEFHFRGERVPITASCGIAEMQASELATDIFKRADTALYRAKENGRNRIELAI